MLTMGEKEYIKFEPYLKSIYNYKQFHKYPFDIHKSKEYTARKFIYK